MIPDEVTELALGIGSDSVEAIETKKYGTIYLLVFGEGARVGLPVFLYYDDGMLATSSKEQSLWLLDNEYFSEA